MLRDLADDVLRWDRAIFIGPTCLYSRSLKPSPLAPARNRSSTASFSREAAAHFRPALTSSNERSNRFEERNRLRSRGKYLRWMHSARQVFQAGRTRIWPLQFSDEFAQPPFGVLRVDGFIQRCPVGGLHLVVQTGALRQFGH